MERWRQVFRDGIAPQLSTAGLEALRDALVEDDRKLVQGTTVRYSLRAFNTVVGACAIGYCGWRGNGLKTGGEITKYFDEICTYGGIWAYPFTEWYDQTPRAEMRPLLLAEVQRVLAERGAKVGEGASS